MSIKQCGIAVCWMTGLALAVCPVFGQETGADDGKVYTMTSVREVGVIDKIELTLEAVGDVIQFLEGMESQSRKMQMLAGFRYEERTEKYDAQSLEHLQSVRYYDVARAEIQVGDQTAKPALDLNRRQIVCDVRDNKVSLFSSIGPLKDDQMLLIEDLPANSLLLEQLLPDKPVKTGDSWTFPDDVLAPLLSLDAIESQDLKAVLTSVKDDIALVEINGEVEAAYLGAGSAMNIRMMYQFDLIAKRIVWLGLVITESRSLGNVGPAVDLIAKLTLKIQPDVEPVQLKKDRVIIIPDDIEKHLTLMYDSPDKGAWRFLHGRNWYVIYDLPGSTKMRLMVNGELISQCDVVQMGKADGASPTKLTDFQRDLKNELKDSFGKFLDATEGKTSKGYNEMRVVISNEAEDMPLVWIYYLLTKTDGTQVILAFVVRQDMLDEFNDADHAIIDSFEIISASRR
ncbi:MAG: hypothetical protein FWH27_00520 [Planctomycetaceae bacterium]|nr:hypothetical protein [Planctomycetaceae bacterium]